MGNIIPHERSEPGTSSATVIACRYILAEAGLLRYLPNVRTWLAKSMMPKQQLMEKADYLQKKTEMIKLQRFCSLADCDKITL